MYLESFFKQFFCHIHPLENFPQTIKTQGLQFYCFFVYLWSNDTVRICLKGYCSLMNLGVGETYVLYLYENKYFTWLKISCEYTPSFVGHWVLLSNLILLLFPFFLFLSYKYFWSESHKWFNLISSSNFDINVTQHKNIKLGRDLVNFFINIFSVCVWGGICVWHMCVGRGWLSSLFFLSII